MNPDQIEQLLTSYALGDLDADTARTVEAHLEHNEASRRTLSEIRETLGVLQRALQTPLPAGVDTLDPVRRAAVLAPPEMEAAASRPLPLPIPWYTGWLRMAATLALTGGAVWVGVRQFAGESDRALRSETEITGAPMDITLVDESDLAPASKPAQTVPPAPSAPGWDVPATIAAKTGEKRGEALQEYADAKGRAPTYDNLRNPEIVGKAGAVKEMTQPQNAYKFAAKEEAAGERFMQANAPAASPEPVQSYTGAQSNLSITDETKKREAKEESHSFRQELSLRVLEEGKYDQMVDADDYRVGGQGGGGQSGAGQVGAGEGEDFDDRVKVREPAKDLGGVNRSIAQAVGQTEVSAPASPAAPLVALDAQMDARSRRKAGPDPAQDESAGRARDQVAPSLGLNSPPTATPAEPEAESPLSGQQFDGDRARNNVITGYSQSASREAAQFAALEQNLGVFNAAGGKMQVDTSLYPGVRARPGSVGADTMGSLAKSKLASVSGRVDASSGAVFQFGFVHPFNLAAMLEETITGGRVNRAELGAQPERWAASFSYAVSGRAMGDMRAGVRRIASPENDHEVLVVMVDSGKDPVAVSMRVVLRPDAASRSRLIGYESNVTLIPGDFAPPGSLAVAVIDLENPRVGSEPLGRLEVSWTTPDGQGGRETLPLQDAGLGEADAAWAAAMAMTADAMRRDDEEAQQAWGRIVAAHLRNRPGTPEARVVEALRRILPAAVPVPTFRKS